VKKEAPKKSPRNNLKPPWKPGHSGNPKGRPKGVRNFKTIFKKAAKEVAEALKLGKKPDAVQIELVKRGIREGLAGNFPFYKDLIERLYGKVEEPIKIKEEKMPEQIPEVSELEKRVAKIYAEELKKSLRKPIKIQRAGLDKQRADKRRKRKSD